MAVYEVKPQSSSRLKAKKISEALKKAGFKKKENPEIEREMLEVKQLAPDLGSDNVLDDRFRESIEYAKGLIDKMKMN